MLVIGFFFVRRQLQMPVPLLLPLTCCASRCFPVYLYLCLLVLRPNAGAGFLPFFLQSVMGRSEVETGCC